MPASHNKIVFFLSLLFFFMLRIFALRESALCSCALLYLRLARSEIFVSGQWNGVLVVTSSVTFKKLWVFTVPWLHEMFCCATKERQIKHSRSIFIYKCSGASLRACLRNSPNDTAFSLSGIYTFLYVSRVHTRFRYFILFHTDLHLLLLTV